MSELKAMTVLNVLQMGNYDNVLVYFKSEADKVIAEKDKTIVELKKACNDKDDWCLHTLKENRHHKHKRCLAMAELCRAKRDEIIARTPTLILNHPTEYLTRWQNRWLELAKKFKEVKNDRT